MTTEAYSIVTSQERTELDRLYNAYTVLADQALATLANLAPGSWNDQVGNSIFDPRRSEDPTGMTSLSYLQRAINDFSEVEKDSKPFARNQVVADRERASALKAKMIAIINQIDEHRFENWRQKYESYVLAPASSTLLDTNDYDQLSKPDQNQAAIRVEAEIAALRQKIADVPSSLLPELNDNLSKFFPNQNEYDPFRAKYVSFYERMIARLEERLKNINRALGKETTLVDPTELWRTFGQSLGIFAPDSDGRNPAENSRLEVALLKGCLDNAVNYLWTNPINAKSASQADFEHFPIRTTSQTLNYGGLIGAHLVPGHHLGEQNHLEEAIKQTSEIIMGGAKWEKLIEKNASFDAVLEFAREHFVSGETLHVLQNLPSLGYRKELGYGQANDEPGVGDVAMEATSHYANWNDRYVYLNTAEYAVLEASVNAEIANGHVIIPTVMAINKVTEQMKLQEEKGKLSAIINLPTTIIPDFGLGNSPLTKKISSADVLQDYELHAKKNYNVFVELFKRRLKAAAQVMKEAEKQKLYGIFPYGEKGLTNPNLSRFRTEVAISVGCYCLGIGEEYVPNIDGRLNSGMLKLADGTYRALTDIERQHAIKAGKSGDLLGFDMHVCSLGSLRDDNIDAKSKLTAGRLFLTQLYRRNYEEYGREGYYENGIDMVVTLVPHPWVYMGVGGKRLKSLFGDRQLRKTVDFKKLGILSSGRSLNVIEILDYARQFYPALRDGISVAMGGELHNLATVKTPNTLLSGARTIEPNQTMIGKLVDYSDKVIGYWLDRFMAFEAEVASDGLDREIWQELVSPIDPTLRTGILTPLPQMLRLNDETLHRIVAKVITARAPDRKGVLKVEYRKVYIGIMIIESLIRGAKKEMELDDYAVLKLILTGKVEDSTKQKYQLGGQGGTDAAKASQMFQFSSEELFALLHQANVDLPNALIRAAQEAAGL